MNIKFDTDAWTLAAIWAWLPQVAAGVAAFASFASALLNIAESKFFKRLADRRRALRVLRLRHELAEIELQSDL